MNIRQKEFSKWLKTSRGICLTQIEKEYLKRVSQKIYGSHGLLLADPAQEELSETLQVNKHLLVHPSKPRSRKLGAFVSAKYSELPIAPDSMHMVLMPHTLEFVNNPHQVLREVEKAIRPEGHLIILGFNPVSLFGVRRFFSNEGVWAGQFRSTTKVKDWLNLLGFEVVKSEYHKFLPLMQKDYDLIEDWGKKICPIFAGMYIIVAKKRMLSATPQKPGWRRAAKLIKKGLAKPASRDICGD